LRKPLIGVLAAVFALAIAAVAYAQTQTNTYSVTASTKPTKAGTRSKPVPVGVTFDYTVGEANGLRPSPIVGYSILLGGVRFNGANFPKCTAAQINAAGTDRPCPSGAKVGSGNVENQTGATTNTADKSLACHLDLTIYNGGRGHLALYLLGGAPTCPISISVAIDAKLVTRASGTAIQFAVPSTLAHPIPGFDNAVVQTASTLPKRVSKGTGFQESTGGCRSGKRVVTVTFTAENGASSTAGTTANCTT
jgi:hypothetical protein